MHLRRVGFFVHRAYSELDFLVQRRHFERSAVVGTPGCSPSLQNAQKATHTNTLFLTLSLSLFVACAKALFRAR